MLTADMKAYRKNYYKENREYLLSYSKWYYRYLKYEEGLISYDELENKPIKDKEVKKRRSKNNYDPVLKEYKQKPSMKKIYGNFVVVFP